MLDKIRWDNLLLRLTGNAPPPDVFDRLVRAYSEPHRHYHTAFHIENCLAEFDAIATLCEAPDEVEFAIWLHDVVYDPRASNNEERSAELAVDILAMAHYPRQKAAAIRELILATRHDRQPITPDARLLVDVDLSILGQPPEVFGMYEKAIRAEYSWAPEEAYRTGRAKILRSFLDRPAIYCTDTFENKYGAQARKNITKTLTGLEW